MSKENYAVACATDDADNVTCVAGDGGEVHFNLSAVQAYDDDQAAAYASAHDLGPGRDGAMAADEDNYAEGDYSDDLTSDEDCDPNYEGACLDPNSHDYDCEGGSGDGPDYTGTVRVVGDDPYDLDRDGDGIACDV